MACKPIGGPGTFVVPGWGCCSCRKYNGNQRPRCTNCMHERCDGVAAVDREGLRRDVRNMGQEASEELLDAAMVQKDEPS